MTAHNPFKYFKTSPQIIRLAVMYYVRYPLSFRQVEDVLHKRGIDICHETVRFWVDRFGARFAKEIRKKRVGQHSNWQWHLDEVFVKINGERFYLWRAVDHEGEVLECYVTRWRNKAAAKKFLIKAMRKHGLPKVIITDKLGSYGAACREIGIAENSHLPFRRRERAMLRFRRTATLQKFVSIHASIQNHFNKERHLYSRANFKLNRAAALAE
jgi:putative transposase